MTQNHCHNNRVRRCVAKLDTILPFSVTYPEERQTDGACHCGTVLDYRVLPRDAMRKRGTSCRSVSVRPSVRLSVGPSVTLVSCIQTAKHIVKLLSLPDGPKLLGFLAQAPLPNFRRNPHQRGR